MTSVKPTTVKQACQLQSIIDRIIMPKKLKEKPLVASELKFLLELMRKQLKGSKTAMIDVESPINICGDTHGQYRDVLRMFDACGWPPTHRYLFLGDYVDRGKRSVEVVCLMFAFKLTFPKQFFVLRGNHEAKEINKNYGFCEEVKMRFGEQLWVEFNEVFTWLPLVALVDESYLCMHGGIPAKLKSLDDLRKLPIPIESPKENDTVADLLWSDPCEDINGFEPNPRGLGHQFGEDALSAFLSKHGLHMIIRAHQVFKQGYCMFGNGQCLTVFSAPNYGGEFFNNASCFQLGYNAEGKICDGVFNLRILEPFGKDVPKQ